MKKWPILFSRFHTQYENDKMGLWCLQIKIHKTAAPFGPDKHQIVCRLGLCPRPHWGSLQRSPRSLAGLGGGTTRGRGRREGRGKEGEGRGGDEKGSWTPRFLDGLTPLDRIIPIVYQDGYDGRLVIGLSCLTEWVYSCYFSNQPIRSKEQLWWQQFLWIFDLALFYKT